METGSTESEKGSGHKVEERKFWLDACLDKGLTNLI